MNLEILEKFIELIQFRTESPASYEAIRDIENELRELVKGESEKGGDATCATTQESSQMSSSNPSVASNPPSDVQAEGRGEVPLAFSCWVEARGVWPRLTHEEIFQAGWNAALGIKEKNKTLPHNPDNLPSPGEGYRFLDEDEVNADSDIALQEIEIWSRGNWSPLCFGCDPLATYRIFAHISREQLAKLRDTKQEAGK